MTETPDSPSPPQRTKGDVAHAVVKAAIGSIPLVGAAGTELFAYVVEAPYEKRREDWMRSVGDAIAELRDSRGVNIEELRNDPDFTDTVLLATQSALRTRETSKQDALRNAILNTALPFAPEAAVRHTFIRLVDEFTPWHLRLLDLFDDPVSWQKRTGRTVPELYAGGLSHLIEHAYPDIRSRRDLYDQWWSDLRARGLVNTDTLHAMMTGRRLLESRTTKLGAQFLSFIRAPSPPAG